MMTNKEKWDGMVNSINEMVDGKYYNTMVVTMNPKDSHIILSGVDNCMFIFDESIELETFNIVGTRDIIKHT